MEVSVISIRIQVKPALHFLEFEKSLSVTYSSPDLILFSGLCLCFRSIFVLIVQGSKLVEDTRHI